MSRADDFSVASCGSSPPTSAATSATTWPRPSTTSGATSSRKETPWRPSTLVGHDSRHRDDGAAGASRSAEGRRAVRAAQSGAQPGLHRRRRPGARRRDRCEHGDVQHRERRADPGAPLQQSRLARHDVREDSWRAGREVPLLRAGLRDRPRRGPFVLRDGGLSQRDLRALGHRRAAAPRRHARIAGAVRRPRRLAGPRTRADAG